MLRQRYLVGGLMIVALTGVGTASSALRQAHLQRQMNDLGDLAEQQNRRLGEILQAQRMSMAAIGELNRKISELASTPPSAAGKSAAIVKDRAIESAAASPAESPEILERMDRARVLVDSAMATGHWTEQDRNDLRALLRTVPLQRGNVLRDRVIAALNARQLDFPVAGPPF